MRISGKKSNEESWGIAGLACYIAAFVLFSWAIVGTSLIRVPSGSFATLKKNYFGAALPAGQVVAAKGELGPQAAITTAGWHFKLGITLVNDIEFHEVLVVPPGKCALLMARDGLFATSGAAFAPLWKDSEKSRMINDAAYFLGEGKGVRGPQSTVLFPGAYTPNPYLWDKMKLVDATTIKQGTVGVVNSFVQGPVDFGLFKRTPSEDGKLRVLTGARIPRGEGHHSTSGLVPTGNIGVWEEALPTGLYYINPEAYIITHVPSVATVYEYRGGYEKRIANLEVDEKSQVKMTVTTSQVPADPNAADTAIVTKIEGWEVPQEMRVLVQIDPELAPFVVANLKLTQENATELIENRVITPVIRSVARDVAGGAVLPFQTQKMILDEKGLPILGADGTPKTTVVHEVRAAKLMDFVENRSALENAMEQKAREEAAKDGIVIMEVRLSESVLPAEYMGSRKREQLAQQLTRAMMQEESAQMQRQKTENARATAEQQQDLVKGQIAALVAEQQKQAAITKAEGEKAIMLAQAEGQKAQMDVLGADATMKMQMFNTAVRELREVIQTNPQMITAGLQNANKFVPNTVINTSGVGGADNAQASMFMALFGRMLEEKPGKFADVIPLPSTKPAQASNQ